MGDRGAIQLDIGLVVSSLGGNSSQDYYIGSAEGHEYPDLQVGDEVNPRPDFIFS